MFVPGGSGLGISLGRTRGRMSCKVMTGLVGKTPPVNQSGHFSLRLLLVGIFNRRQ
jgi:hypothetical protein